MLRCREAADAHTTSGPPVGAWRRRHISRAKPEACNLAARQFALQFSRDKETLNPHSS